MNRRSFVQVWLASLAAAVISLPACSSDDPSSTDNTTPATATTSTSPPAETSSSTPSSSAASTTVAPDTSLPTTNEVASTTTEAAPATSDEPTETDATKPVSTDTDETTAESTGDTAVGSEYMPVDPPEVPDETHVVLADNTRPDGVYYATVSEGGDPPPAVGAVVFEIVQLFRGEQCIEHFGLDDEDACVNDYGVETDPTAYVELPLTDQYITVVDAATQQSYQVSGTELYGLILGEVPTAGAPPDYFYSGFGFLATFVRGKVIRLEQWWTP